jgi:hypothetical protein
MVTPQTDQEIKIKRKSGRPKNTNKHYIKPNIRNNLNEIIKIEFKKIIETIKENNFILNFDD